LAGSGEPDSARFDPARQCTSERATEHAERATAPYLGKRTEAEAEGWVIACASGSYRRCTPSKAAGDWVHVGANANTARQTKAGAWVRIA